MNLAPADDLDHVVAVLPHLNDLAADFQSDFVDNAQNIAFGNGSIRAHDEVRAAQGIKVGGMVGAVKGHVEQFAQFLGGGGDIDVINRVDGLGGGHVVSLRADTADAIGQQGHFLDRASDAEAFEPAQFRDLEVGIGNITFFVQEYLDLAMAFQPGDGIYGNPLHDDYPFCAALLARRSEPARLKR